MGVSVRAIIPEITIATLTVTANSRNNRPISPPINNNGRKTAINEKVIERIVKPISRDPIKAACNGRSPASIWRDIFHHHDGVVDDETDRDGERHQRYVVDGIAD